MIKLWMDPSSGLPPYLQVVRQIRQALLLGRLREGDKLPTVKALAARLKINQNTVLKAYRELEYDGLVDAQPGVGTFIHSTVADATLAAHVPLRQQLSQWVTAAQQAGLDDETIHALFDTTLRGEGPDEAAPLAS